MRLLPHLIKFPLQWQRLITLGHVLTAHQLFLSIAARWRELCHLRIGVVISCFRVLATELGIKEDLIDVGSLGEASLGAALAFTG